VSPFLTVTFYCRIEERRYSKERLLHNSETRGKESGDLCATKTVTCQRLCESQTERPGSITQDFFDCNVLSLNRVEDILLFWVITKLSDKSPRETRLVTRGRQRSGLGSVCDALESVCDAFLPWPFFTISRRNYNFLSDYHTNLRRERYWPDLPHRSVVPQRFLGIRVPQGLSSRVRVFPHCELLYSSFGPDKLFERPGKGTSRVPSRSEVRLPVEALSSPVLHIPLLSRNVFIFYIFF